MTLKTGVMMLKMLYHQGNNGGVSYTIMTHKAFLSGLNILNRSRKKKMHIGIR